MLGFKCIALFSNMYMLTKLLIDCLFQVYNIDSFEEQHVHFVVCFSTSMEFIAGNILPECLDYI